MNFHLIPSYPTWFCSQLCPLSSYTSPEWHVRSSGTEKRRSPRWQGTEKGPFEWSLNIPIFISSFTPLLDKHIITNSWHLGNSGMSTALFLKFYLNSLSKILPFSAPPSCALPGGHGVTNSWAYRTGGSPALSHIACWLSPLPEGDSTFSTLPNLWPSFGFLAAILTIFCSLSFLCLCVFMQWKNLIKHFILLKFY